MRSCVVAQPAPWKVSTEVPSRTRSTDFADIEPEALRVLTEALGLSRRQVAALTGYDERTVGRWWNGTSKVPAAVVAQVQGLAGRTEDLVDTLIQRLGRTEGDERCLGTYRTDDAFTASHEDPLLQGVPASWHRAACGRVLMVLPDVRVRWLD